VGQDGLKVIHVWHHSQKIRTPQPKNFFRVQTRRLNAFFDALTRSVALTDREKFSRKATSVSVFFFRKSKSGRTLKC